MDPVSLAVGAVLLAAGFLGGRLSRRTSSPAPPVTPVCGCGHPLSQHDPSTHSCHSEVPRDSFTRWGRWAGHTWVACPCRQYVGPLPVDEVFVPRVLPPS